MASSALSGSARLPPRPRGRALPLAMLAALAALLAAAPVPAQAGMALSLVAPPPGVLFINVELIASPVVPWPCAR